ncbi:MAG: polymerase subunit epsilon, partial [Actinomycetota bacterium]|nr:polymerase subunit epsilon [Actinomycetota bacterium]
MQRSFDDLGTPLCDVTFVVVDLETTGGAPGAHAITEIGAVKLKGGECLGTFQTLVNPQAPIPPAITYLTGITQSMVLPAPKIDEVLPAFLEFAGDAVLVGHNVRFDASHLNAALRAHGRAKLHQRIVDTCGLARRLVRDEVPNCTLSTLSEYFRVGHRPTHRALDDALATGELLHCLLERAGTIGVTGLDDLLALPTVKGHPQLSKLKLVTNLPRKPGVYLFRDRNGRVLYVGKAVDIRRRVRSYFSGDERRKVGQLLREAEAIDHIVCSGELEASVLEVRLIHELAPRFNRQMKRWKKYAYLKLTLDERFPRLSVVKAPKAGDGCLYLGPLGSAGTARAVADAIEAATPIRRCSAKVTKTPRSAPCASAQLGVAACPCAHAISEADYAAIVALVVRGLTREPALLLAPLAAKMTALAAAERYEEAATVRDRAGALSRALIRQRRIDSLRQAGRLTVEIPGEGGAVLDHGLLVSAWSGDRSAASAEALPLTTETATSDGPVPRHLIDELACVAAWIEAKAARIRLVACEGGLALPL